MTPNHNTDLNLSQPQDLATKNSTTQPPTTPTAQNQTTPTTDTPHKRRVRYKGTHPRSFHEKYKEANPEKYADVIEKVISKGSTPAGMHLSIMVEEILEALDIQPGQVGLDATLGYGGHTKAMLQKLEGQGHIYGLDVDPIEIVKTKKRLEDQGFGPEILTVCKINFANIDRVAAYAYEAQQNPDRESGSAIVDFEQIEADTTTAHNGVFDFVLADLGVSSMQIDTPERGFSYKIDGPLDLRLDPEHGESAAQRLASITRDEFVGMLLDNSDEPFAEEIADEIFGRMRRGMTIDTTTALKDAIEAAINRQPEKRLRAVADTMNTAHGADALRQELTKKSCARVFQALRIDVNSEFEVLYSFLEKLPGILKPGGKAAILTFHSGEDRLVKQSFKQLKKAGIYSEASDDVTRPSPEECRRNPRAKSTKLRWAVRSDMPM